MAITEGGWGYGRQRRQILLDLAEQLTGRLLARPL